MKEEGLAEEPGGEQRKDIPYGVRGEAAAWGKAGMMRHMHT